ncbi:MAG: hypothetical protein F4X82_02995 [Candidatus Spechtbacteria bacterium SB0662_bin_43]|uniref:CRISPR-associated endonuclease Cas1 n=1 Tax=Candidatus Spechtbacteria bacterium SB0662_bin_43 TaxID=2604897 RepID=A0A845DBN5_9BACT|nr:hypothetical protein [Candidatus Spechtbacteria bacterium SB0662_bin_43]
MNKRLPLWLPYTNKIVYTKNSVSFIYKGGELKSRFREIQSIFFYGAVCPLEEGFLTLCSRYKIPICIHRRHMHQAIWITNSFDTNIDDVVTQQILYRRNKKKQFHIAYKLLKAKVKGMSWLIAPPDLPSYKPKNINDLRVIEAWHARKYWDEYYKRLGFSKSNRRGGADSNNIVTSALDAISKLITGVILRWVLYHKLSPYHGFFHITTEYPALIYDLIEPYRGYFDKVVFDTFQEKEDVSKWDGQKFIGAATNNVEAFLDKKIYTPQTQQIVTFQELLHGSALALRAYLVKDCTRFVVPMPGKRNGGRPIKAGYKLYGRHAGFTDFQKSINEEIEEIDHERLWYG